MMKYYIYKLKFLTPVRFGSSSAGAGLAQSKISCHADTLFSALGQEWINIYGNRGFNEFIEAARNNRLLISDLYPWHDLELYLPKPVLPPLFQQDVDDEGKTDKKLMKQLAYIPVSKFRAYIDFLRDGVELPWNSGHEGFAYEVLLYRANIVREIETMPYLVSAYRFVGTGGLYFILQSSEFWREKFDIVIESLGLSGIGGKRSSGLGKFELAEESFEIGLYDSDCILEEMLKEDGGVYMSLSVLAPAQDDLAVIKQGKSYYSLIRRTGFVASPVYAGTQLKRKPVVMFDAGSCFPAKIKGRILDVSDNGGHPVYRYGKGMYLGVKM
ncbi:type III-A CRISPR-associated RAMP protein Csm4 [Desulfotruncus alcoholivorax]|uniref:type III-A CRISPR-associated RAMP protein Csm4 n=1 Tax=Desulfotruncus alcoholivorax TaxID=265477 RepID=UPI0003F9B4E9|nr:type III-A CRISPR-associated RAMP protein Csm4 [Desulfotruncus alcoholivorax]